MDETQTFFVLNEVELQKVVDGYLAAFDGRQLDFDEIYKGTEEEPTTDAVKNALQFLCQNTGILIPAVV